jgi:hypothetical protein
MVNHGSSHGLAVLICSILAAILVDLLRPHFPVLLDRLSALSNWFLKYVPIPFNTEQFNIILVASILAIIWGIFFKLSLKKE